MSIWLHPNGKLASKLGHREDLDKTGEALTDLEHKALLDQDSQRLGLSFLNLLSTAPEPNPMQDNIWKEFMVAISFSGDPAHLPYPCHRHPTHGRHEYRKPPRRDESIQGIEGIDEG